MLNLALTVERHHSGSHHWVVMELEPCGDAYHRLLESSQTFEVQADAFLAGCAALCRLLPPCAPDASAGGWQPPRTV